MISLSLPAAPFGQLPVWIGITPKRGYEEAPFFFRQDKRASRSPEKTVIFEDSIAGIIAAERAKALEVVVVDSTGKNSYSGRHRVITCVDEFDGRVLLNE